MIRNIIHIALMGILIIAFRGGVYVGIASTLQDRESWIKSNPEWLHELALNAWEAGI